MDTVMDPAPMEVKESEIELDTPDTVVTKAITAVTPIMIPNMVKNDLSRFFMILATDMETLSTNMKLFFEIFANRFLTAAFRPPPSGCRQ